MMAVQDEHSGVGAPNDWDIFSRDLHQEGSSAAPVNGSLSPPGRSEHDPAMDDLLQLFLKSSDTATVWHLDHEMLLGACMSLQSQVYSHLFWKSLGCLTGIAWRQVTWRGV